MTAPGGVDINDDELLVILGEESVEMFFVFDGGGQLNFLGRHLNEEVSNYNAISYYNLGTR